MPDLKNPTEDIFIDHLTDLKQSEGWSIYQKWLAETKAGMLRELLKPERDHAETNFNRGQIDALGLAQRGLDILIAQKEEEIKEAERERDNNAS